MSALDGKSKIITIICFIYIIGSSFGKSNKHDCNNGLQNKQLIEKLANAQSQFSFDLYKDLAVHSQFNWVVSPLSLSTSLVMYLISGQDSDAEKAIKPILHLQDFSKLDHINKAFGSVIRTLCQRDGGNWSVSIANRIYASTGLTIAKSNAASLRKYYRSRIVPLNFQAHNSQKIAANINKWVKKQTGGKIKNVVSPENIDSQLKMFLVNAIYFKASWSSKFNSDETSSRDFYFNSNKKILVDTMSKQDVFYHSHSEELKCKMLSLDYVGDRISMLIILPDDIDGLENLDKKITPESFNSLRNKLKPEEIIVYLPKFQLGQVQILNPLQRIESKMKLNTTYFAGSKLVHRAYLNINEEGTEAAAVTEYKLLFLSAVNEFKVDHPFLFVLYDKLTHIIMFIGRVNFPFHVTQ